VIPDLLDEARRELSQKTLKDIERDTAWKWAARAVAAYQLGDYGRIPTLYRDCVTYAGEAFEHAVFADETGETLQAVRSWVYHYIPRGVL
jgi:hypothetical protein